MIPEFVSVDSPYICSKSINSSTRQKMHILSSISDESRNWNKIKNSLKFLLIYERWKNREIVGRYLLRKVGYSFYWFACFNHNGLLT